MIGDFIQFADYYSFYSYFLEYPVEMVIKKVTNIVIILQNSVIIRPQPMSITPASCTVYN